MSDPPVGRRVLIVEDESLIAMTAEDMLENVGWRPVGVATSCRSALAAVAKGGFDIAMIDINLRGEDSGPVADALAQAGIPFIFTTGYGKARVPERHREAGIIAKPYDARSLDAALQAAAR
ncbi:MAG: response regulator [Parasphingopyxis sp.]|nr:response regulator [Sphingomonadales bacterium]